MKGVELETLIFYSGGTCFGIDLEQIAQMAEPDDEFDVLTMQQLLGEPIAATPGGATKRIVVKGKEPLALLIPEPEEVIRLSLPDLRRLPETFQVAQQFGIWAVAIWNDRLIALLDLHKNKVLNNVENRTYSI